VGCAKVEPSRAQFDHQRHQRRRAAYKSHFELCRNCVRCPRHSPTNTDVSWFTSRRMLWREVVEWLARRGVSASLGERRPLRFPSVLLQPLGHLSVFRIIHLRTTRVRESLVCDTSSNLLCTVTASGRSRVIHAVAKRPPIDPDSGSRDRPNWIVRSLQEHRELEGLGPINRAFIGKYVRQFDLLR